MGGAYPQFREWAWRQIARFMPKTFSSIKYKQVFGRELSWKHPRDINEKIHWLKFYGDTSNWDILADKYRVRDFVESKGYGHMLVKLYGKWDRARDIDWNSLPSQFVMKVNNGCGDIKFCHDKSEINVDEWSKHFDKMMHAKIGYSLAELHYNKIKPCIIAEEMLDYKQQLFDSSSLVDYKIFCFDGTPFCILMCFNRTEHNCEVMTFDTDWNPHPEYCVSTEHFILTKRIVPRPKSLEEMLAAAAKLSEGLPQVRVDLYEIAGKPLFGEMTLTSTAGFINFYTQDFLNQLGDKIILPTDKK